MAAALRAQEPVKGLAGVSINQVKAKTDPPLHDEVLSVSEAFAERLSNSLLILGSAPRDPRFASAIMVCLNRHVAKKKAESATHFLPALAHSDRKKPPQNPAQEYSGSAFASAKFLTNNEVATRNLQIVCLA